MKLSFRLLTAMIAQITIYLSRMADTIFRPEILIQILTGRQGFAKEFQFLLPSESDKLSTRTNFSGGASLP